MYAPKWQGMHMHTRFCTRYVHGTRDCNLQRVGTGNYDVVATVKWRLATGDRKTENGGTWTMAVATRFECLATPVLSAISYVSVIPNQSISPPPILGTHAR